jgi:two-component system phosphate regulon response regulator OmpR
MPTPPRTRVLLVDDDEALCGLLSEYLEPFGFAVAAVHHPDEGLAAIAKDPPDIVVLDVMMPDTDGFAVCRKVRETSRVPIVMLTARGGVLDRIVGLEMGADDYLPKPFEPRELVARLQAVLRRAGDRREGERLRAGALEVDAVARTARLGGRTLELTAAELALLGLFLRSRGTVLSRDRILEATRGLDWEAFDRSVDVLVSRLRQKLGDDPRQPRFIKTVRGAGYCFIGGGA